MSSSTFVVQEHTVPTTHIREYARATQDQDDVLHLAVKQYTPREQFSAQNEVTVIGGHANGFPKELYEPLWDELYSRLKAKGIRISNIFIADVAHQGASSALNENELGNDPSWLDHPRDLFLMVNHFRQFMKRPIIGVGHSMGGNNLVNLSIMHPRLFTSLILMDPVIQRHPSQKGNFAPAKASAKRRDRWPSRTIAAESFKRSKFYQSWDPRVLGKWTQYGLRDLPTALYPKPLPAAASSAEVEVTLSTTKHQEVLSFARGNFASEEYPFPSTDPNPVIHPDADLDFYQLAPFTRPEPISTFHKLPFVRPSVFYIFGELSDMCTEQMMMDKLSVTGVGVGGSGGVKKGRVSSTVIGGVGHLIPMEDVNGTADAAVSWIGPEIERWRKIEDAERREWATVPTDRRSQMTDEFVGTIGGDWRKILAEEKTRKARL